MLRKGSSAAKLDQGAFTKWEKGQLSTEEALKIFRINNGIGERETIHESEFIMFLESLGYRRHF